MALALFLDIMFYVVIFLPFLVVWFTTYYYAKKLESPLERISLVWYLPPIFLGWVGVLLNYHFLKKRNHKVVIRSIKISVIVSTIILVWIIISLLVLIWGIINIDLLYG